MAVNLHPPENLLPVAGIKLGTAMAGIRKFGRRDLCLIALEEGARVSGVFTRNAFCAAPVQVARRHLSSGEVRALVINTGTANAGTGKQGLDNAEESCRLVAEQLGCEPSQVLPFSTGVIAEHLKVERIATALPILQEALQENDWSKAAEAIMTTDTLPKAVSRQCSVDGKTVTVTGMSKGAGMIRPDMATMLAFVATDAAVSQQALDACLKVAVGQSFNCITVDGDTSTNDACVLMASGKAENQALSPQHPDYTEWVKTVVEVMTVLAQSIVRDGEGATKFITIDVLQAESTEEARAVADTIAHSPLVKTALFAGDPNWGRILAAIGRSPVNDLDMSSVNLWLDTVRLIRDGEIDDDYKEAAAAEVVGADEFVIRVALGRGSSQARVWTCDLSYDYVRINAEYRS